MAFNPQVDQGGSGTGGGDTESDEESSEVDSQLPQNQGSLAEPEVDESAARMSAAQDRDLNTVQQREQQTIDVGNIDGSGGTPVGGSGQQSVDPEPTAPSQPGVAPGGPPRPVGGEPISGTTEITPTGDTGFPEPQPVDPDRVDIPGSANPEADADPTATTGVTRGELLESEGVQDFLAETGLEARDIEFTSVEASGTTRRFSVDVTEEGEDRFRLLQAGDRGPTVSGGQQFIPIGAVDRTVGAQAAAEDRRQAGAARLSGAAAATSAQANVIEQRLEQQIEAETGRDVDLDQGDIDFTRDEEGDIQASLAQSGVDKVATDPLSDFLEEKGIDVNVRPVEVLEGPLGGVLPRAPASLIGAGLRFQEETKPLGPIAEDVGVERDFGDFIGGREVPVFNQRPVTPGPGAAPREQIGTTTVDESLASIAEDVRFVDLGDPAFTGVGERPGRAGAGQAQEAEEFTGVGFEAAQAGSKAFIEAPGVFATGAGQLAVDIADFEAELVGAVSPELGEREITPGPGAGDRPQLAGPGLDRAGELFSDLDQTVVNTLAVGASEAIEAPGITAARAGGTLAASGLIFGGAAAVGGRTSLATRFAIQPGEEIAGIGGFGVTRRLAGRSTAQRLFPNKEPLIFSEEAVLRGLRRGKRGIETRMGDYEIPSFEAAGAETTFGEVSKQADIEIERGRDVLGQVRGEPPGVKGVVGGDKKTVGLAGEQPGDILRGKFAEGEGFEEPGDMKLDEPGPDDFEGGGGMSVGGSTEFKAIAETQTKSGQVVQQEVRFDRGEFEIETEPKMGLDVELEQEARARRLETNLFAEEVTGAETSGFDQVFEPGEVATPGEGVGELQVFEFDQDFEPTDLETEFEDTEFEFETEPQPKELLIEDETELELELELETELESELELERGGSRLRERDKRLDELADEFFEKESFFERTETPFQDIDSDLTDIENELEDLD